MIGTQLYRFNKEFASQKESEDFFSILTDALKALGDFEVEAVGSEVVKSEENPFKDGRCFSKAELKALPEGTKLSHSFTGSPFPSGHFWQKVNGKWLDGGCGFGAAGDDGGLDWGTRVIIA